MSGPHSMKTGSPLSVFTTVDGAEVGHLRQRRPGGHESGRPRSRRDQRECARARAVDDDARSKLVAGRSADRDFAVAIVQ